MMQSLVFMHKVRTVDVLHEVANALLERLYNQCTFMGSEIPDPEMYVIDLKTILNARAKDMLYGIDDDGECEKILELAEKQLCRECGQILPSVTIAGVLISAVSIELHNFKEHSSNTGDRDDLKRFLELTVEYIEHGEPYEGRINDPKYYLPAN